MWNTFLLLFYSNFSWHRAPQMKLGQLLIKIQKLIKIHIGINWQKTSKLLLIRPKTPAEIFHKYRNSKTNILHFQRKSHKKLQKLFTVEKCCQICYLPSSYDFIWEWFWFVDNSSKMATYTWIRVIFLNMIIKLTLEAFATCWIGLLNSNVVFL